MKRIAAAACLLLISRAELAFAGPAPSRSSPRAESSGAQRIYRGVYQRRGSAASSERLFWYERWCRSEGEQVRCTHSHHRFGGSVLLRQSALHGADYELSEFESDHRQTGVSARAKVLGPGRVRLTRISGSEREDVVLEHEHPLVVGPTLYGVMLRHWADLMAGRSLIVDYLSIERLDTFAFEIRRLASDASTTTFELSAKGLILSLLVSPLRVVFLTRTREVLRYEGPSPVLLESRAERESFDARIEYTERAQGFR